MFLYIPSARDIACGGVDQKTLMTIFYNKCCFLSQHKPINYSRTIIKQEKSFKKDRATLYEISKRHEDITFSITYFIQIYINIKPLRILLV